MKHTDYHVPLQKPARTFGSMRGFSLLELMVSSAVLFVVVGGAVNYLGLVTQRSRAEQTKVDLTQEGREFVDEFERDIHQAGYPGCTMFNTIGFGGCAANFNNLNIAAGLAYVSNTRIIFEGDVDGDGVVDSIQYELVDSAGAWPPAGTCPCTIRRSQVAKAGVWPVAPLLQPTNWSQEVQNVVNSGVPGGTTMYGGGLPISGNVLFGGGAITNDAYYAAVTTFKDFPVFSAYDQNGTVIALPVDNTTAAGQAILSGNSPTGITSI